MAELLERADLWVIGIYMLVMMAIGWYVSSESRDVEGYAVGGRTMTGWVLGLSVLGTFTSSITFLSLPAKTFQGNWNVYVFGLALPVAALVAVTWFVPLYRSKVQLSAFEFLESRFGYWARLYADLSYVVLQLIRTATIMLLVAMAVQGTLGFPIVPTLILSGVVVIVYDAVGGIRADIWTDVVQVFVLVFGAAWALGSVLATWPGDPADFLSHVPPEKFSLGQLTNWVPASSQAESKAAAGHWDWSLSTVLVVFLYGLSENLRNYGTDQNYVQRMLAADSDRSARRSLWIGALSYLPVSAMVCLIGTALYMHYQAHPALLPQGLKADEVFPHFMRTELPPAVRGLVISAILAAAMSTIDSCLNSTSTLILVDVVRRLRRGPARLPEIWTLRLSTVALGVLGTGAAVGMYYRFGAERSRTIMDLWWQYAGTAGGGLFGLFLLAWLMPRIPAWGAALGVAATVPVLAWGTFARQIPTNSNWAPLECRLHPNLVGISATLAMLLLAGCLAVAVRAGLLAPNRRYSPQPPSRD
jgi:SSS family solute:Na+ symporter